MSAFIFDSDLLKNGSKREKLEMMKAQMGAPPRPDWGDTIGVIHLYVPKNMYDVMGSKVIEMSEELKAFKVGRNKVGISKSKNSICHGVYEKLNQPLVREIVDQNNIPMMQYIKDFFKKFAVMYIHHYKEGGRLTGDMYTLLNRIIGFEGNVFLLEKTVKSQFSKPSREFFFEHSPGGPPSFVLKVFTSYSKSDEKDEVYSPIGVNVEQALLKYAEEIAIAPAIDDKSNALDAYNLWPEESPCPYGKIPPMANANSNNYLMHSEETIRNDAGQVIRSNRLFLVNHRHQYIGSLLALIDYCHDFLDSSGDRTAEGYSTASTEIRETIWGWIKKLKIQTSAGSNMFYVVKGIQEMGDDFIDRTEAQRAEALVTDVTTAVSGDRGVVVKLFTDDDDMEKTLSNMAYLRDTLFDNDGSYIFFYPGFLFIDEEDGQTGEEKFKSKLGQQDQPALRCCYYRGADEVLVPGDSSNTTILYEGLNNLIGVKSPLYVRLTGVNKKANGKGINKMLQKTYGNYFIRENDEKIYQGEYEFKGGSGKAITDSNNYDPADKGLFQEKLFSHISDPAFGPNFVRDCGSSDALVESIMGYQQFPFMGERTGGIRARQAIFSAIMDPATGVENDPLLNHEYYSILRTKNNIRYTENNTLNLPKVVLPYMYVWWPKIDGNSGELELKGVIFIQLELAFITSQILNNGKDAMQSIFTHLKNEKNIPEIDRVSANKVTFLVYKKPEGDNSLSLDTCNSDIANGAAGAVKFSFTQISKTPGVSGMCTLLMEYEKYNSDTQNFFLDKEQGNPIVYSDESWATCMYEIGYYISKNALNLNEYAEEFDDPFYDQYENDVLLKWCEKKEKKSTIVKQDEFDELRGINMDDHYFSAHQFAFMFGTTYKTFGDKFRYVDSHIYGIPMETCDTFLVKVSTVGGAFGLYTHSDELLCFGPIDVNSEGAQKDAGAQKQLSEEEKRRLEEEEKKQKKNLSDVLISIAGDDGVYVNFNEIQMCDLDLWNPFFLEKPIIYKLDGRLIPQEFLYKIHLALSLLILKFYNVINKVSVNRRISFLIEGVDEDQLMLRKLNIWLHTFNSAFPGDGNSQKPLVYDHYLDSLLSILWYNYESIDINYGSKAKPKDMFNFHQGIKQNNEAISKNLNNLYHYVKNQLHLYYSNLNEQSIIIPNTDGFDFTKLEHYLGLDLMNPNLFYTLYDQSITENHTPVHTQQFIMLQTFIQQLLPSMTGGGFKHFVNVNTAIMLDANQVTPVEIVKDEETELEIPGIQSYLFFSERSLFYDYHNGNKNQIQLNESVIYKEVSEYLLFMYHINSVPEEDPNYTALIKKIKVLAKKMYNLLKIINKPKNEKEATDFCSLLNQMRDLLKEKEQVDKTINIIITQPTDNINNGIKKINVDKLIQKFNFLAEKNNMKYSSYCKKVLLKKLKTNILHIIELIGIKMFNVLEQVRLPLSAKSESSGAGPYIGFESKMPDGTELPKIEYDSRKPSIHRLHTTPISLYMCMLRNSIKTESLIQNDEVVGEEEVVEVGVMEKIKSAEYVIVKYNYCINNKPYHNVNNLNDFPEISSEDAEKSEDEILEQQQIQHRYLDIVNLLNLPGEFKNHIIIFIDCVDDMYFYFNGRIFSEINNLREYAERTTFFKKIDNAVSLLIGKVRSGEIKTEAFLQKKIGRKSSETKVGADSDICPICKFTPPSFIPVVLTDDDTGVLTDDTGVWTNVAHQCYNCEFICQHFYAEDAEENRQKINIRVLDKNGKFDIKNAAQLSNIEDNKSLYINEIINTLLDRNIEITPTELIKLAVYDEHTEMEGLMAAATENFHSTKDSSLTIGGGNKTRKIVRRRGKKTRKNKPPPIPHRNFTKKNFRIKRKNTTRRL